jgi:ATP-dependent helicase HepA
MYRLRIKANYHDIETFMNAEIERLEALRKVNPTVSETEILLLRFNRDNMLKAMDRAELSLDSLRIILS